MSKVIKPMLIVMCGLQCSGKSTKAKEFAENLKGVVLSSDKLREEYKNANDDTIFRILYEKMNDLLGQGIDVILDATNTTIKARKQIFQNLKVDCFTHCHIMNTPYDVCLKRLKKRNKTDYPHKFDADVLKRYYYSFEIPFYEEGWDGIVLDRTPNRDESIRNLLILGRFSEGFNQMNVHHTQDLWTHQRQVGDLLKKQTNNSILIQAGYYHDIGKVFTQTFKDGDPNAHYYNHANVGTYTLLCSCGLYYSLLDDSSDETLYHKNRTLEWLFYINYHMHLFNVQTEKAEKKWRAIFGDEKFNNLKLFNECDRAR